MLGLWRRWWQNITSDASVNSAAKTAASPRQPQNQSHLQGALPPLTQAIDGISDGAHRMSSHIDNTDVAVHALVQGLGLLERDVERAFDHAQHAQTLLNQVGHGQRGSVDTTLVMTEKVKEAAALVGRAMSSGDGLAQNAEQLAAQTQETSMGLHQLDKSSLDVESGIKKTAHLAGQMVHHAQVGVAALTQTVDGIDGIKTTQQGAAHVLSALDARISDIGAIVKVIDEVAARTKLLSLNAAITAAQAGEHGRGFQVVAEQIKELAQRTGASTRLISTLIGDIQAQSQQATQAMDQSMARVDVGITLGKGALEAVHAIVDAAAGVSALIAHVVQSSEDHTHQVKHLTAVSERLARRSTQLAQEASLQARQAPAADHAARSASGLAQEVVRMAQEQNEMHRSVLQAVDDIHALLQRVVEAQRAQQQGADMVQRGVGGMRLTAQSQRQSLDDLGSAMHSLKREISDMPRPQLPPIAKP